jgi:hypothetical protein
MSFGTTILAQDKTSSDNKVIDFLLTPQHEFRLKRPIYIGANAQGFLAGYHFHKNFSFSVAYTPRNYFTKANGLEVGGISEGLGFTDGADDNEIFQITGVDDYENIDQHLTMIDIRYYPIKAISLYLSAGYGLAINSERSVFFSEGTRTIGNTTYDDLDIDVKVLLENAHAFNLGAGIHHFFGPIGIGFSGHWGLNARRLKEAQITSSQTIQASDLAVLNDIIQSEVETEHFGFYQMIFSFSFRL